MLLTLTLGIIGFVGQRNTLSRLDLIAGDHARIADLAAKAVVELTTARKNEIEYLLHNEYALSEGWARHVVHFQRSLIRLRQDLQEMREVLAKPEVNEKCQACDSVEELITKYENGFLEVVGLTEKAGRVDSGLEGDFRRKIHEIEATPELAATPHVMIALLTVRRYEKDYIARARDEDVRNHAANQLGDINVRGSCNLAGDQAQTGRDERFASHATGRVGRQNCIEDSIGNLICDFVRMPFSH